MYSASVHNVNFYGKTRFLSCNSEGKAKRVSDCPFGTAYFGETRGLNELVKRHSYPFAKVEETIGKMHEDKTYRIYVAEPKEYVNDLIKQNHDYIVYDIEPNFPDIRLYFDTEQEDLKKGFQVVKDYFKRLETSTSSKNDIDIFNISKLKQKVADIGEKIFDESENLRTQKYNLENKLNARYIRIREIAENLPLYKKELEIRHSRLVNQEKLLEVKERGLDSCITRKSILEKKINKKPEEIEKVNTQIAKHEEAIRSIKSKIESHKKRIEFLKQYIDEAPEKTIKFEQEAAEIKQKIVDIKKALIPNFRKLKNLYTTNGIKIIKRI